MFFRIVSILESSMSERLSVFRDCFVLSIVDEKTHGALYCNSRNEDKDRLSFNCTYKLVPCPISPCSHSRREALELFDNGMEREKFDGNGLAERSLLMKNVSVLRRTRVSPYNLTYFTMKSQTHSHKEALELTFSITDGHGELCFRIWRMP
ncbi:hypothetical protein V6N11_016907 [Hibiscus sabdariffa]|uniref:Uncharacterized protein n=1 Tax=Hibiscus sabdariffa TaxID=183260 RepID=A0ABR2TWJ2_9ROSI